MMDDGKAGDLREGEAAACEPAHAPRSGSVETIVNRTSRRGLPEQTRLRLGNHLRNLYDSVVHQPVPDRFRDLIAQLDDAEKSKV